MDIGHAPARGPLHARRFRHRSLQAILALPDTTRLFVGDDYGTEEREGPAWEATVAEHRAHSKHIGGGVTEKDYVKLREARDADVGLPDRILYALQVNLRGGQPPPEESDGHRYFRIPANRF